MSLRNFCDNRYTNRLSSRGTVRPGHSFYSARHYFYYLFHSFVLFCFFVLNTFPNCLIPCCLPVFIRSFFLSNSRSSYPCSLLFPNLRSLRLLGLIPAMKINPVHPILLHRQHSLLSKYQPRLHKRSLFRNKKGSDNRTMAV
jgi:hypothetical protein